ncbi:MAG: hypothetical protein AAFN16_23955 [Pseudomonadota bacterium]
MNVLIDVAGFYYRRSVTLPDGGATKTVKDAMVAAKSLGGFPELDFTGETTGGREFLSNIIITHAGGTAVSGQTLSEALPDQRIYEDGVYNAGDDFVIFGEVNGQKRLISPEGKRIISAWQYYVYDENSVDLNRANGPRKVVPYSEPFQVGALVRGLQDGDTIVWRRVSICVAPTIVPAPVVS